MAKVIRLKTDTLTPSLRRAVRGVRNRRPILKAMADTTEQMAKRAFNVSSLRPKAWTPKKDGSPAKLFKTGSLKRSPRTTSVSNRRAFVGSDRGYAAIHQLGGVSRPMPARPYFPFDARGKPTPKLKRNLNTVVRKKLNRQIRKR
ncbi:MAG: phage virion morphogenesis protein [Verrucomicrobiota bacterium]